MGQGMMEGSGEGTMDGKRETEREVVVAQLEETQLLRVFYEESSADAQTNTLHTRRTPRTRRSASNLRLGETRHTRGAP